MDYLKKNYVEPKIELVQLDNEISLALESSPPLGPSEAFLQRNIDGLSFDPFKTNVG